ncbi:MAG: heparan-alpha-glucosaminide N-acetyltransferase domain-containing protein [Bacteroidota bacterium]
MLYIRNAKNAAMTHTNQRFAALDVFRGLTICLMIIVNTPGDGSLTFAPLHHAKWDGFTPTDLVFPSFLFAVGNAMSFVMRKWVEKTTGEVLGKIFKRTLLIFLLGYLMYWFPFVNHDEGHWALSPIAHTRILGVLQRIALCYCFASLLVYFLKTRMVVIVGVGLLLLYWAICFWFGDPADPLSLQGNAGLKLDLWLMGENHLYHGEGVAFDPEGLLSTLPAIVNVVAGYLVGIHVQKSGKTYEGLTKLILAGFVLVIIAYFWNFIFPINKKLWTSSFVLQTVGLDCMILGAVIYLMEMRQKTRFAWFFEVVGKNPLAVYLLSELLVTVLNMIEIGNESSFSWIYQNMFNHVGDYWSSLLFAVCYMLLCWFVGYWMDRRKIYLRV